ncbi:MAG TPA: glycosyltransferase family 4 protein [Negativicutes bacterium]|nr:glycosyltransferase family 4 protein [Negativicutes bacterium]
MATKRPSLSIIELISAREAWGGIEQHALDLSRGLKERGHRVVFATRPVDFVIERYRQVGEVFPFPITGAADLKTIRGLAALIRDEQVDIIHTHTSRDAWTAVFAALAAGRGRVVTTRHVPLAAKTDFVHTWFYNRLAAIICVSEYVRASLLASTPRFDRTKVRVIYPGIRLERFAAGSADRYRRQWGVGDDEFLIGFVGRITVEKGLDDLVVAAAALRRRQIAFKMVLVGDNNVNTPTYLTDLLAAADRQGLGGVVVHQGFTTDIADVMYALDCLVLPSNTPETFGLVLCEALACGKPVIATPTGAQAEIVRDGVNGFLVPPDQPEIMAAALAKLIADRELASRLGAAGRKIVFDDFAIEKTLDKIEHCFWDCLAAEKL